MEIENYGEIRVIYSAFSFSLEKNVKKFQKNVSLVLFLLIPLLLNSLDLLRFNFSSVFLLCHPFSFNHLVYHLKLAITSTYFLVLPSSSCASQCYIFSLFYLQLLQCVTVRHKNCF